MEDRRGPTGKHFSCADDVLLLREATFREPWRAAKILEAWDEITMVLRRTPVFPQDKDGRALKSRLKLLLDKHREKATASLRSSGREEDFQEREQLLEEISAKLRGYEAAKVQERDQKETHKRKRQPSGHLVNDLEAPFGGSDSGSESGVSDQPPRKRQVSVGGEMVASSERTNTLKARELSLLDRQINLQQQQLNLQRQQLELHRFQFQQQAQLQREQLDQQRVFFQQQLEVQNQQVRLMMQLMQSFISSQKDNVQ